MKTYIQRPYRSLGRIGALVKFPCSFSNLCRVKRGYNLRVICSCSDLRRQTVSDQVDPKSYVKGLAATRTGHSQGKTILRIDGRCARTAAPPLLGFLCGHRHHKAIAFHAVRLR